MSWTDQTGTATSWDNQDGADVAWDGLVDWIIGIGVWVDLLRWSDSGVWLDAEIWSDQ